MPELILKGFTEEEEGESHNKWMNGGMERPAKEGQLPWFGLAEVWLLAVPGYLYMEDAARAMATLTCLRLSDAIVAKL